MATFGRKVAGTGSALCTARDRRSAFGWSRAEYGACVKRVAPRRQDRAGSVTAYSWGRDIGNNRANCHGCDSRCDGEKTAPLGSFAANAWGLHDMHGNVREGVQHCWNVDYYGALADGSAWERATAAIACCAAVRGTTFRGTCVRRFAAGTPPETGTSSSVFVLPGQLRHKKKLSAYGFQHSA